MTTELDEYAFEQIEARSGQLLVRAKKLPIRLAEIEGRIDAVAAQRAFGGYAEAETIEPRIDVSAGGAEVDDAVESRISRLVDRSETLIASIEEVPQRIKVLFDPDEVSAIAAHARKFGESLHEAAERVSDYISTVVHEESIAANFEQLLTNGESVQQDIEERVGSVGECFQAWSEELGDLAHTISRSQNQWLASLQENWSERAKALSLIVEHELAELESEGEALISKLDSMIESIGSAFEDLSRLRGAVDDGTVAAQGGLSSVTEIISEVKEIFEAVR